jgi:hypothetical protein
MDKPCTSTRFSRRALLSTLAAIPVLPELLYPNAAKAQAPVAPLASWNDWARLMMLMHNDAEREYAHGPALVSRTPKWAHSRRRFTTRRRGTAGQSSV